MINIYLIRHGKPDFPDDRTCCLGHTDLPLCDLGRMQSSLLAASFSMQGIPGFDAVYTSPLSRTRETAAFLFAPVRKTIASLQERDFGVWDGLSFDAIRKNWPKLYEARGYDHSLPIPGEESADAAALRFSEAIREILQSSVCAAKQELHLAVVSHNDIISSYLTGSDPEHRTKQELKLPYAGFYHLKFPSVKAEYTTDYKKEMPLPPLTKELCKTLRQSISLPENICSHCDAVAENALRIVRELEVSGITLDSEAIYLAALLHDISRLHPLHAGYGGRCIEALGYPKIGNLIAQHHSCCHTTINEAAIVFLADKEIRETTRVPIQYRFTHSRAKCRTEEAKQKHENQMLQSLYLKELINTRCQKEVIL